MNRSTFIGNLTRDPELRTVKTENQDDVSVCSFNVAAQNGWGEHKRVEYVRVTAWRGLAETCARYLVKGAKVYVAGTASANGYINSEGKVVANIELGLDEIEFLSSKPVTTTVPYQAVSEDDIEDLL